MIILKKRLAQNNQINTVHEAPEDSDLIRRCTNTFYV